MNEASTSWRNGFAWDPCTVFIEEIFTTCLGSASVFNNLAALIRENMCPKKTQASEPGSQNRQLPWEGLEEEGGFGYSSWGPEPQQALTLGLTKHLPCL